MAASKYVSIYLNDHRAAFVALRDVARRSRRANRGTELGDYLATVAADLETSCRELDGLFGRLGVRRDPLKRGAAWAAEKLGRLKVNGHLVRYSPLSRVLELEGLIAGAEIEERTWTALGPVTGDDFSALVRAARERREELARRHAAAVALALGGGAPSQTP